LERLPVILALDRGGLVGEDGATHHGIFDYSYLRCLPNMVVMAPRDENELRRMMLTALQHDGPIAFRYPRGAAVGSPLDTTVRPIRIGKAKVLKEGDDVVLLSVGSSVMEALKAHGLLAEQGVQATVVDCRFVKPLDAALTLDLARRIPRVLTIEENVRQGGFGSAVLEAINDAGLNSVAVERIGLPDAFVEHGPQALLRNKYGLGAAAITQATLRFLQQNDYPPAADRSFRTRLASAGL
jgi:1-deoxy-D-xylulose-5-phosphate synthase